MTFNVLSDLTVIACRRKPETSLSCADLLVSILYRWMEQSADSIFEKRESEIRPDNLKYPNFTEHITLSVGTVSSSIDRRSCFSFFKISFKEVDSLSDRKHIVSRSSALFLKLWEKTNERGQSEIDSNLIVLLKCVVEAQ